MKSKAFLLILIINFILISCSSWEISQTSTNNNSVSTKTSAITSNNQATVKVITIDPRCVWCGKCARIDSLHFNMNYSTHKAEPIQTTGNKNSLNHAIDDCPVWAISVS